MSKHRANSGSALRFLDWTGLPRSRFIESLAALLPDDVRVTADDHWMPCGHAAPKEAQLDKVGDEFLAPEIRNELAGWWLVDRRRGTPHWDFVSTCTLGGQRGLVLMEGKARTGEVNSGKASRSREPNASQIRRAVSHASRELNKSLPGFALSDRHHFQLSNRFAWAWKLADLKVPTVLIYLGWLNATEMPKKPFTSAANWEQCVRTYATGVVPGGVWEKRLDINGTPIYPLIRSLDLRFVT